MASSSNHNEDMSTLVSDCVCGKVTLRVQIPKTPSSSSDDKIAVDCHCPRCRKFHVAAFASYLQVPSDNVDWGDSLDDLQTYSETCQEVGPVDRLFCKHCYTKMASKPIVTTNESPTETASPTMLINMGGLVDKTIPKLWKDTWSKEGGRTMWQSSSQACWTHAQPPRRRVPTLDSTPKTTGSCACGKCQYQIRHVPYEMQHCYCRLCRQLSGAAFQSWIPVENEDLIWKTTTDDSDDNASSSGPLLKVTTQHGKRHICTHCGGCLTIVYNDQPEMTWPAAGGLDDASLPQVMDPHLHRVCHICCTWKQSWYSIPKDGLERIKYAC